MKRDIYVDVSSRNKSQIYEQFGMAMNKNKVELLDIPRLRSQTMGLQRFLKSGGQVRVDHYRGGHDDTINSAAGVCLLALENEPRDMEILVL